MRIRVVDLVNNFYNDENFQSRDKTKRLGEYCCLGYFDALDVKSLDRVPSEKVNIRRQVDQNTIQKLDGNSNRRNVICITDDDEKDAEFWQEADQMPFLFISLIRMKYNQKDGGLESDGLSALVTSINAHKNEVMAYYTYGHSDMVVFRYGNNYLENLEEVCSRYNTVQIFKMYSIFAVKEKYLHPNVALSDEQVMCRLHAVVKNMQYINDYIMELKRVLRVEIKCFDTLGNSDLLIEIPCVSLNELLKCYRMGEILTHSNDIYQKAFFNIESHVINVKEREIETLNKLEEV